MYICPVCKNKLHKRGENFFCKNCKTVYEFENNSISFLQRLADSTNAIERTYDTINQLYNSSPGGRFVQFLNLGYTENDGESLLDNSIFSNTKINRNSISLILKIFKTINLNNKRIIDIGCGRCGTLNLLSQLYPQGMYWGCDICNTGFTKKLSNVELFSCDVQSIIPLKNCYIDIAYSIEVIHTISNKETALKNIRKILKNNGLLILADALTENEWNDWVFCAISNGFKINQKIDISKNVITSCREISSNRLKMLGQQFCEIIGAPGSKFYDNLVNGVLKYKILYLEKNDKGKTV